ncbi:MAG: hypothetical protein GYA57_00145 [Myxococcales bacterium]|nr:hypothetical protein [Myxococcales bacterium]
MRGSASRLWVVALILSLAAGCGRTELDARPWHDYDAGRPVLPPPDVGPDRAPDAEPDAPPDAEPDAQPDTEPDAPPDVRPDDADTYEFHGLSCMSAALCAFCCSPGDYGCMMGCVGAADPSESATLMNIVSCAMGAGCGADMGCLMEECQDELSACGGGPGGTGGCLSLAWCLVSSGCASVAECEEQGLCYQTCFGAARPEAVGAARELVVCIAGDCLTACSGGLTTIDCLGCLATNCLSALRGCVGF